MQLIPAQSPHTADGCMVITLSLFSMDEVDDNDLLLQKNELRGFVEIGFSSASPDKDVALFYAGKCDSTCKYEDAGGGKHSDFVYCDCHRSTLLEIDTGQVDRGKGFINPHRYLRAHSNIYTLDGSLLHGGKAVGTDF